MGCFFVFLFVLGHPSILVEQDGITSPRKPNSLWLEESKKESGSVREAGVGPGGSGREQQKEGDPSRNEKATDRRSS